MESNPSISTQPSVKYNARKGREERYTCDDQFPLHLSVHAAAFNHSAFRVANLYLLLASPPQ